MALTEKQRISIIEVAEDMQEQLIAISAKQCTLFAKLSKLPPTGALSTADNSVVRLRGCSVLLSCSVPPVLTNEGFSNS